ncbi:MAG TPA: pitrilysin family protein [Enhygromyxa sp.]|nr:pitrilysin family protein [Enhygromyxa sp.]
MKIRNHRLISITAGVVLLASLGLGACDKGTGDTTPPDQPTKTDPQPEQTAKRVFPDPPPPSEQRPVNFPELQKFELPNKLTVYIVENHEVPLVDVQLVIKAGTIHDELIAGLTADMLGEGTKKRSKAKIDEEIEQIGSSLSSSAGEHNSAIATRVLKPNLKFALELVNDVAQNPKFDEAALAKLRDQQKVAIQGEKSDGGALANRLTSLVLFPKGHPYAQPFPTDAEIDAIKADDLRKFHETWYRPNNAYLILSGDVTKAEVEKLIEKTLGTWKPAESFPAHPLEAFTGDDYQKAVPKDFVVHLVDRNQISTDIVLANINSVARNHPDWEKMSALTKLFGGGMSSQLFRDIRETKELTYNIGAYQAPQKAVGVFAIVTQTKKTDEMLNALFGHIERLRTSDPTDVEFKTAVDNMALSFPLQIETASQIAGKVATQLTYNLPDDYYNKYIDEVRKIQIADMQATAAKYVHPIPVIVIVGKASKVRQQLKDVPQLADAKIIEYDTDLNPKG